MSDIKFGTDGWRALIAKDYTVNNVARVTIAVAQWLKENYDNPSVVIGHDCRFGGEMFSQTVAKVLASQGVKVEIAKGFCSSVQFLWQRSVDCWLILETNSPRLQTLTITSDAHPTDNEWLITIGLNSFFCEESY